MAQLSEESERHVHSGFRARAHNGLAAEMRAQRLAFQCEELSRQLIRLRMAVSAFLRTTQPDERREAEHDLRYEMARVGQFAEEPRI